MQQFRETKTLLDEMRTDINKQISTVKTDLEGKLQTVTNEISSLRADCAAKFNLNDDAVNALNAQVKVVTDEVSNLENRNDLIVNGIPFLQGEDLMVYFKAMLKHVGLGEAACPLVDLRRLYMRSSNGKEAAPVKIHFALKTARDDFYYAYLEKRDLQLCHLGINSNRRVYVNESLTVGARKVKAAAVRLKQDGKVSSVFTKRGIVQVKSAPGATAVAVFSEEQLRQFSS